MANLINLTINDTGYIGLPSGTLAQRPVTPLTGYTRFNTTLGAIETYNGSVWINPATNLAVEGPIISTNMLFHVDAGNPLSFRNTNRIWHDISGNGAHFLFGGSSSFNSSNGGSIDFGAGGGYAYRANGMNLQQNFTLEIWCYITANSAGLFGQGPTNTSQGLHILWNSSASRGIVFGLYSNDLDTPSYNLSFNTWHQFVFTHNSSTSVKQFYADGSLINSHTGSASYGGSGQFNIGSIYSNPIYANMQGRISIARGYSTVLSANDILQNFNAQRSRYNL
jgi:hypothetical protein